MMKLKFLISTLLITAFLSSPLEAAKYSTKKNKAPISYDRKKFKHWVDLDGDCQNTRNEILIARSNVPVTFKKNKKGDCVVKSGEWSDFYYFETLSEAQNIDIDHIVPLKHAWTAGANTWTPKKREVFANDHENLVITNKKYNRQKGAKTILEWMPVEKSYACQYIKRWFEIKEKYDLKITQKEIEYSDLSKCI